MSIAMYDSITVSTIPPNPQAVAGYVGGFWPDYAQEVQAFPHAHHLSIAVNASEDAECLDVEAGDAVPSQAPAWVKRQIARGVKRPVVYASLSSMRSVIDALNAAGLSRDDVRLWTAHYTFAPHFCGPSEGFGMNTTADATQWSDHALGRNLDESVVQDSFFGDPHPPVKNTTHYDWFDNRPRAIAGGKTERWIVEQYDKYRKTQTKTKHPNRVKLALLRKSLQLLANRVNSVAHKQKVKGKPSWGVEHRGWRYQNLAKRAAGQRFV